MSAIAVADIDPDTLIRTVRSELKLGKAQGLDEVYKEIIKKAIGTGFYANLAPALTLSFKLPYARKIAVLCMLITPDKPPSQTTSYRSIS